MPAVKNPMRRNAAALHGSNDTRNDSTRLLGLSGAMDPGELRARILAGLPIAAWRQFLSATRLPEQILRATLRIPLRTLARRKAEHRLQPDESDRLARIARIYALALELFANDYESTNDWLLKSQPALGGATPLEFASTEVGAREVEALIGRIEHGIPS